MTTRPATTSLSLAELESELEQATIDHEAAMQRESVARRDSSSALNRVNAAQKAIETRLDELRKKASRDTDWHRTRHPGAPVAALLLAVALAVT